MYIFTYIHIMIYYVYCRIDVLNWPERETAPLTLWPSHDSCFFFRAPMHQEIWDHLCMRPSPNIDLSWVVDWKTTFLHGWLSGSIWEDWYPIHSTGLIIVTQGPYHFSFFLLQLAARSRFKWDWQNPAVQFNMFNYALSCHILARSLGRGLPNAPSNCFKQGWYLDVFPSQWQWRQIFGRRWTCHGSVRDPRDD